MDAKELEMGIRHEEEHADLVDLIRRGIDGNRLLLSPQDIYEAIARAHLAEHPNYYTVLTDAEAKMQTPDVDLTRGVNRK